MQAAYIGGLGIAFGVNAVTHMGQPALLYLVRHSTLGRVLFLPFYSSVTLISIGLNLFVMFFDTAACAHYTAFSGSAGFSLHISLDSKF